MQLSLKINATFAENKCNFLALLLQQKLALVITNELHEQCSVGSE